MLSDYTTLYHSSMLSSICLTFTATLAITIGNFTVSVDDPSDNLASKFVNLNNNGRYLCHGSAPHGELPTIGSSCISHCVVLLLLTQRKLVINEI